MSMAMKILQIFVNCFLILWLLLRGTAGPVPAAREEAGHGTALYRGSSGSFIMEPRPSGVSPASPGPATGRNPTVNDSGWLFSGDRRIGGAAGCSSAPIKSTSLWPDITCAGERHVGVVWMDDREGGYHIYFSRSTDGGTTWSAPERVDDAPTGDNCRFPSIAIDERGAFYCAWEDDREFTFRVYSSRRLPGGEGRRWTASRAVNSAGGPPDPSYHMKPCLTAASRGLLGIAWTDWREGPLHQVYFSASTDGGVSWGENVRVSDRMGSRPVAGYPTVSADPADPQRIYCAFNGWREPGAFRYPDVYLSSSSNGGAIWSENVRVNDVTDYFQQVAHRTIGVDGNGTICIEWMNNDFTGPTEARLSRSADGGLTFPPSVRVNDRKQGIGTYPCLDVLPDGRMASTWMDYRNGNWDVYFACSEDGGESWLEPDIRVDDDRSGSAAYNPVVSLSPSGDACVVWQDYRSGACYDILFSRAAHPPRPESME